MNNYSSLTLTLKSSLDGETTQTFHFVKSYNKLFHNAQHLLLDLNSKERCFFDYLCEKMDDKNGIYADVHLKEDFLSHYAKIKRKGGAEIKVAHITTYLKKLRELGLILENTSRTYYIINPKYAFNSTIEKRLLLIKSLIYERNSKNLPINQLIDKVL